MLTALPITMLTLWAQVPGPPQPQPAPPPPQYFELLENNSHIIYPVLAVLVLMVLAAGIAQAWRGQDLNGVQKAELKRAIVVELRKHGGTMSAEPLSKAVGLEPFKLVRLLEEMQRDGILTSFTNTQRLTFWQMKGNSGGTR